MPSLNLRTDWISAKRACFVVFILYSLFIPALVDAQIGSKIPGDSNEHTTPPVVVPTSTNTDPLLAEGTYTINSSVPTGGLNFQTFNDAVNALRSGITGPVVFNVVPGSGPYNEQVTISPVIGTSATNTITFNGNGATVTNGVQAANAAVIDLDGADHIILDNLTIIADAAYYGGLRLFNHADSNIVRNCTINEVVRGKYFFTSGISIGNEVVTFDPPTCILNLVQGSTISGFYHGIKLTGTTNNTVLRNTILDLGETGILSRGNTNLIIANNDVSHQQKTSTAIFYGIYLNGQHANILIRNNRIHDPFESVLRNSQSAVGICLSGASGSVGKEIEVSNNLVFNMYNCVGSGNGILQSSGGWAKYYNNTIVFDDTATNSPGRVVGMVAFIFGPPFPANFADFKNNLVTITRRGNGPNYGLLFDTSASGFSSDYNDFYINGASGLNYVARHRDNHLTNLVQWQSTSGRDPHSVSIDPIFSDLASGTFKPLSPNLDNKGTYVGIAADIVGNSRSSTTPDIGAYEFSGVVPITFSGRVFLQGAYNQASGLMINFLNHRGILQSKAATQPYSNAPFYYPGSESVSPGFFEAHNGIIDWVLLEIRDAVSPSTIVARKAVFLTQNGMLVDLDGMSTKISLTGLTPAKYYISVRHRNHLAIRSSSLVDFSSGTGDYDFTTSPGKSYQAQPYASTVQINSVHAMRAGDANANGNVRYSGPANDQNHLLNVKLGGSLSLVLTNVYSPEDMNMDGTITYNGPGNDQNFLLNIIFSGFLGTMYVEQL
ncbi:hypothetical protein EXU57_03115 [Segetibacter sp. 3557_3]|uniref:right-handed parallel beta-helix repeat-containing protein n=1 Tax=Segetibacter sp. 3557_3 TaxID=2547429 RepID=UPI0010586196|nr:right-handed parallel beta-helix repeat-containing protein [Segetibacter sp. 3557_3]TDH29075.1 hypothetical protein EXU57_03115 [Segetibacter sp. 3557_3]